MTSAGALLTSDNPLLSQATTQMNWRTSAINGSGGSKPVEGHPMQMNWRTSAINCTLDLPSEVETYIHEAVASNTRRAYLSDLAHFQAWGGYIPASPETLATYLAAHASTLSVATLVRRAAAIAKSHKARKFTNPASSELVRATMRGIKRTRGCGQREAKPLLRDDLLLVLDAIGDGLKASRDKALLLIGFAGGLRRSELVGLDVADVEHVRQGIILYLRRSKTDQDGKGQKLGIPHGRTRWFLTAVAQGDLMDWLQKLNPHSRPLMRLADMYAPAPRPDQRAVSVITLRLLPW